HPLDLDCFPTRRSSDLEKRRLTYKSFLANYQRVLKPGGGLELKTDNMGFFEYSLTSFNNYGLVFDGVWLDLHHAAENEGNVETRSEEHTSELQSRFDLV